MKACVTGAAGFIGSTLVDRLLANGHSVVGVDNLSTGFCEFLAGARQNAQFQLIEADLTRLDDVIAAFVDVDVVFHLSANADVRHGVHQTFRDLEQNTIVTYNVLEAMRCNGVKIIAFSSTGSVYGDAAVIPTPEDAPFPTQTSLYGASKVAGEGLITAYSEAFGIRALIFRFVSILGPRYTHGHVFDFYKSLRGDPTRLYVLGNGKQRKSYLHVDDCVSAILTALERHEGRVGIFNLGGDAYCEVNDSIGWICGELKVRPGLEYSGGDRGWIGDSPFIYLQCTRIQNLGWRPQHSIEQAVRLTVRWLQENTWVYESRA